MKAVIGLLLCAALAPAATIVTIDTSTTLLDASTFSNGTTYLAAWQLTGSGAVSNTATISAFLLGGGTGLDVQGGEPDPTFTVSPSALDVAGIWQSGAVLEMLVNPSDSYSLYSQGFIAGDSFSFAVDLTSNLLAGSAPDAFSFQLYDAAVETLLYEVVLELSGEPVPEPSPVSLTLFGLAALGVLLRRR